MHRYVRRWRAPYHPVIGAIAGKFSVSSLFQQHS
jgi:hypothetical protein